MMPPPAPLPARPEKLTVEFVAESDRLAIINRNRRLSEPGCFLFLWLIGWTVGCVFLVGLVIQEPTLGNLAFATPFMTAWIGVASFLVWLFCGSEILVLTTEGAYFRRKALINLSSRFVPRDEIERFCECQSSYQENGYYLWGIELQSSGKPLKCLFRLAMEERLWLIAELNQFYALDAPKATNGAQPDASETEQLADAAGTSIQRVSSSPGNIVLQPDANATQPSDSNWTLEEEFDGCVLVERGRWQIGAVAILLFFCGFWNGIVSVFVLALWGFLPNPQPMGRGEWWGMFVFLIPFEVIGLVMFLALLAAIWDPWRRTEWRFASTEISKRVRWPIISNVSRWPVSKLSRMELRRKTDSTSRNQIRFQNSDAITYSLALVTAENIDLCCIDGLSSGEARWIAQVIRQRQPNWFQQ